MARNEFHAILGYKKACHKEEWVWRVFWVRKVEVKVFSKLTTPIPARTNVDFKLLGRQRIPIGPVISNV